MCFLLRVRWASLEQIIVRLSIELRLLWFDYNLKLVGFVLFCVCVISNTKKETSRNFLCETTGTPKNVAHVL